MDSVDQQVLSAMLDWAQQQHRFLLVTVAQTWGSAPRQPGAWMAIRDDGWVQGSVSGGCIEADLLDQVRHGLLYKVERDAHGRARPYRQRYGLSHDEAAHFGLPCGGILELVVEPEPDIALLRQLDSRVQAGQLVQRCVDLQSGQVQLEPASRLDGTYWDSVRLRTSYGPRWRLLMIGAGQIARYLAPIAQSLGYAVAVCDPRPEFYQQWHVPQAHWLPGMPDDVVLEMGLDQHSAVVALTHDPKLDDLALIEALRSPAFYVGVLGSIRTQAKRRERLRQYFDFSAAELARLHGPVGLAIGSKTPAEIAVAIAAELITVRHHLKPLLSSSDALSPASQPVALS